MCSSCGKACRSQAEQKLHTVHTGARLASPLPAGCTAGSPRAVRLAGHTDFVNKTNEAVTMDTETEMAQISDRLEKEAAAERMPLKAPDNTELVGCCAQTRAAVLSPSA